MSEWEADMEAAVAHPKPRRRATDRSPHERIDEIEDDLISLRERVSAMEAATKSLGRSIDGLRTEVSAMRAHITEEVRGIRDGILATFSRMFLSLVLVILIAFGVVGSIVGGSVYFEGLGVKGGTNATSDQGVN